MPDNISLQKSSTTGSYSEVKDTIDYNYAVTNSGDVILAEPVTIIDDKTFATCALSGDGDLDPGETITCTALDYVVTEADIGDSETPKSVTNVATAFADGAISNQATVTVHWLDPDLPARSCTLHYECDQGEFCHYNA